MKLPDLYITSEYADIPPELYSDATGKPFSSCLLCKCDLLTPGTLYIIEKAVKNYKDFNTTDTIFEYAMCFACVEKFRGKISDTSRARIDIYFAERVDLVQRRERLIAAEEFDPKEWLSHCIIKGKRAHEFSEYQLYCQCDGTQLIFAYMPFMIGGEAMDEMMQLLSNETLGEIGGFMNEYFGVPPELEINPLDRPVLIF